MKMSCRSCGIERHRMVSVDLYTAIIRAYGHTVMHMNDRMNPRKHFASLLCPRCLEVALERFLREAPREKMHWETDIQYWQDLISDATANIERIKKVEEERNASIKL